MGNKKKRTMTCECSVTGREFPCMQTEAEMRYTPMKAKTRNGIKADVSR